MTTRMIHQSIEWIEVSSRQPVQSTRFETDRELVTADRGCPTVTDHVARTAVETMGLVG